MKTSPVLLLFVLNFLSLSEAKAGEFIATDLSEKLRQAWGDFSGNARALTSDSSGALYIGTDAGRFAKYDPSTDSLTDLTPHLSALPGAAWQNAAIEALTIDPDHGILYLGGFLFGANAAGFAGYILSTDTAFDLSDRISGPYWESVRISAMSFDRVHEVVYLGGDYLAFARYNTSTYAGGGPYPDPDTAYDLTDVLLAAIGVSNTPSFVLDEAHGVLFVGGDTGAGLARYNTTTYAGGDPYPDPDTAYYLPLDTNSVFDLVFNPEDGGVVYLAGFSESYGGEFTRYNTTTYTGGGLYPEADTGYSLTPKLADLGLDTGLLELSALAFDPLHKDLYLGTENRGRLLRYATATDTATDLTAEISSFWYLPETDRLAGITDLAFEPRTSSVYLVGNGKFAKIGPNHSGPQFIDLQCPGPASFPNHGKFVRCVAHAAKHAADQDLISPREKARFVRNAAHAK